MSIPSGIINCDTCGSMNDHKWKVCCKCGADPLVDEESASYERAIESSTRRADKVEKPGIGLTWRHRNGALYVVRLFTNEFSERAEYPVTVVYEGAGGKMWSRPLSDWHRSFTAM